MAVDHADFAEECVRRAVFFGVNPHYMIAVASMRSGIDDAEASGLVGPFRLTQAEWDANRSSSEFDVELESTAITEWGMQCIVFAFMTYQTQNKLVTKLSRFPSAVELYHEQWPNDPAKLPDALQSALEATSALIGPAADKIYGEPVVPSPIITDPIKPLPNPPADSGISPAPGASDIDAACKVIAHFEGFQKHAYWDVNHWRVGFGSDTYCTKGPDGHWIQAVVLQTTSTDRDAAYADLYRRVNRFEQGVIAEVGQSTWNKLPVPARAALVSIAYNYGHLPKDIAAAVSSGDTSQIADAILAHRQDNKGVNSSRRTAEANIVSHGEIMTA